MSILTGLQTRLMEKLAEGDAFWTGTITVNGETQQAGKKFETLIESCLREMGQTFGRAPSQQPQDFRDVGGVGLYFDSKKTDGNRIMLNDTIPKRGTWQVIFATKFRKVLIVPAEYWLDDESCVGIQEQQDEIMAIRRRAKRFGAFSVCARANISLDIKDVLDRCSTGSCELIARA